MDLEELSDKYRALKPQMRYGLLAAVGLLPAVYLWMDTGDSLEVRRVQVESDYAAERQTFEDARQKAAELPALEAKLSEIEGELVKAKEFLPDRIEIDTILAFLGGLEKEFDVKLVKFTPGIASMAQGAVEYKEMPVELIMNGTFANTMRFMDRLVHMQNLTHLRNITFSVPEDSEVKIEEGKEAPLPETSKRVDCNAKLILFKGV
ncbi:MAG: type 4a pilus biogenesis protein PilO [Bdellovibrionota bacterium]